MTAESALRASYDALLLDLDGTLYRGNDAVPGAVDALRGGSRLLYVTNNASRSPGDVASHLAELGFDASDSDVVTSSQAAARLLQDRLAPDDVVLVVGTEALADEVRAVGLRPTRDAHDHPRAVVQGHSTETAWPILAEAVYAIGAGALWVAANTDTTLPTERGFAPGNGAMVAAVRAATGTEPLVAGKPAAPLLEDALQRCGSRNALVVGDRLDTDIAGANQVGLESLLVLTGVSTADDLFRAQPHERPTYVALSLDALNAPASVSRVDAVGDWDVAVDGTDLVLAGNGDANAALRAVAHAAWQLPEFGNLRSADDNAEQAVRRWNTRA